MALTNRDFFFNQIIEFKHNLFYKKQALIDPYTKYFRLPINIEDKRVALGDSIKLKGFGDVGVNLYRNDKQLLTARANVQLEYVNRRHFLLCLSGVNLIHTEGSANTLNDGFTHLRYNYDLHKRWVYEAFGQGQYNERTRVLFRGLVGTGVRLKLKHGKKQRYYLGLAYFLENTAYDSDPRLPESVPDWIYTLTNGLRFEF